MRLPKKIRINNIPFRVVKDKTCFGASFSYRKALMTIGTKGDSREVLENFLHEVAEASAIERGIRSVRSKPSGEENEYMFSGSHNDFRDMMTDVSVIVGDLMKLD